jgi:transcriptional regulator with XRE-family HTH domain
MAKKPTIGEQVKAFRLDRQMTQPKVAEFLGVSRATIARLERGEDCGDLTRSKIEKLLQQGQAA